MYPTLLAQHRKHMRQRFSEITLEETFYGDIFSYEEVIAFMYREEAHLVAQAIRELNEKES